MKPKVCIAMSTYNGSNNIERQLDSIINQEDVEVYLVIRDDGSTDNTVEVIEKYIVNNNLENIEVLSEHNIGWAKSFWKTICQCPKADYYAFSDQDDVWYKDKLIKCIKKMREDKDYVGPKLSYCKMQRTDSNLEKFEVSPEILHPEVLTKKIVLTQVFAYGASIVMNADAKELICRCDITDDFIAHDGGHDGLAQLLCFWFGRVYFVNEQLYDWVRYETSVTGNGTKWNGYYFRIKEILSGKSYYNVSSILLDNYSDLLSEKDLYFLKNLSEAKNRLKPRFTVFFDKDFRRVSLIGTITLKIGVLLGRF